MTAKLLPLLLLVFLLAPRVRGAEDEAKDQLKPLQGGWKLETLEIDGKPADLFQEASIWWVVKGDKVFYGGSELATLTVDPKTTPKCIDLAFREPKRVFEAIYAIEDDTLEICVSQATEGIKERPGEFSTKGKPGFRMLVFKRDKERTAESTEGLNGFVGIMIKTEDGGKQVIISGVIAGSPAEKAGLKKDDVLLKVDDEEATNLKSVVNHVRKVKPGSELMLHLKRDGKDQDIAIKAQVMPFYLLD